MVNTKQSLKDLSFIGNDADGNILQLIDRCQTFIGRSVLQTILAQSPKDYASLQAQQEVVRFWTDNPQLWPQQISNGTMVMLEKFYESADSFSGQPGRGNWLNSKFFQKIFRRNEYHFVQFSVSHLADFMRGCFAFVALLNNTELNIPLQLQQHLQAMQDLLGHPLCGQLAKINNNSSYKEVAQTSFYARRQIKSQVQELSHHFAQLDAWHSLATATTEHGWNFPQLYPASNTCFEANGLYHPLLPSAISYDIKFNATHNFMILTGANMSGKTTLMRAMGVAAVLAHLGMGVPAQNLRISFMQAVFTNMHVEDNLLRGESFFMAEVKNIKQTVQAILQAGPKMVLMDELFKGTNVHDACECTKAIIQGLLQYPQHIMVLSTHLHEVAHYFEHQSQLSFYCFGIQLNDNNAFSFDYKLRPGISDERIGYKILAQQGIVAMLQKGES